MLFGFLSLPNAPIKTQIDILF